MPLQGKLTDAGNCFCESCTSTKDPPLAGDATQGKLSDAAKSFDAEGVSPPPVKLTELGTLLRSVSIKGKLADAERVVGARERQSTCRGSESHGTCSNMDPDLGIIDPFLGTEDASPGAIDVTPQGNMTVAACLAGDGTAPSTLAFPSSQGKLTDDDKPLSPKGVGLAETDARPQGKLTDADAATGCCRCMEEVRSHD